jgi:hypothetical protein
MALFQKKLKMAGFTPLADPSQDAIVKQLAEWPFGTVSLEARDDYANSLLAWAEGVGPAEFNKWRGIIVDTEVSIAAKAWHLRYPDDDLETSRIRIQATILSFFEIKFRRPAKAWEDVYPMFETHIPNVVVEFYGVLVQSRDKQS